jgi:hypothetical protein
VVLLHQPRLQRRGHLNDLFFCVFMGGVAHNNQSKVQ